MFMSHFTSLPSNTTLHSIVYEWITHLIASVSKLNEKNDFLIRPSHHQEIDIDRNSYLYIYSIYLRLQLMLFSSPLRSHEHDISGTPRGNLLKLCADVHLDSKTN